MSNVHVFKKNPLIITSHLLSFVMILRDVIDDKQVSAHLRNSSLPFKMQLFVFVLDRFLQFSVYLPFPLLPRSNVSLYHLIKIAATRTVQLQSTAADSYSSNSMNVAEVEIQTQKRLISLQTTKRQILCNTKMLMRKVPLF